MPDLVAVLLFSNFMLMDEEGSHGCVNLKAIDFGCSQRILEGTPLQIRMGTPIFFAPEVFRKWYGVEADCWSAGIMVKYIPSPLQSCFAALPACIHVALQQPLLSYKIARQHGRKRADAGNVQQKRCYLCIPVFPLGGLVAPRRSSLVLMNFLWPDVSDVVRTVPILECRGAGNTNSAGCDAAGGWRYGPIP